jgi:tRNA pseudouridine38-40 synthase
MKKAALLLEGEHDFKSFCTKSNSKKSTIRTIYDITITEQQGIIRICYHGNGFLYNMIRILSGTLIDIGFACATGFILYSLINKFYGLRMTAQEELIGSDRVFHNIEAYPEESL